MTVTVSNGQTTAGNYWERLQPVELVLANPTKPEYPNALRFFDDTDANGVIIVQVKSRKVATLTFEGWDDVGGVFCEDIVKLVRAELAKR